MDSRSWFDPIVAQLLLAAAQRAYARRLRAQLTGAALPRHVALVMDGNRRWARRTGFDDPSVGHRYGAEHVDEVLGWCTELGIRYVTIFVVSVDNLRKRAPGEVDFLMRMIEEAAALRLARPSNEWRLHVAGRLDLLPESTRHALTLARDSTSDPDARHHLTVAVAYDGREEVVHAVRSLLDHEARGGTTLDHLARHVTANDIAAHLYTSDLPDPDLVIRTSGERRMSGFLLWQASQSELYFCDVNWPGFGKVDFLRALRSYARRRHRR
jgi:short-chain Z-isoprenyl diphosphate synthase